MIDLYNKGILRGILIYTIILLLFILSINNLFIKREGHSYNMENDNHHLDHERWHKGECKYDSNQSANSTTSPSIGDHDHNEDPDLTAQRSPIGVSLEDLAPTAQLSANRLKLALA
tara:strand:- start:15265 stop:15612 length:348 start_codon:yes stop_codon:yes gene_type:complete